jgi:hypothetical protein
VKSINWKLVLVCMLMSALVSYNVVKWKSRPSPTDVTATCDYQARVKALETKGWYSIEFRQDNSDPWKVEYQPRGGEWKARIETRGETACIALTELESVLTIMNRGAPK